MQREFRRLMTVPRLGRRHHNGSGQNFGRGWKGVSGTNRFGAVNDHPSSLFQGKPCGERGAIVVPCHAPKKVRLVEARSVAKQTIPTIPIGPTSRTESC